MRLLRFLAALAITLSLTGAASAQERPDLSENAWLDYDVASLKLGDWVKYKLDRDGEPSVEFRMACVAVEAGVVWIEEDRTTVESFPGTVILCSVSTADRKVKRAFWGKPGARGLELQLTKARVADPGNDAAKGTAEVTAGNVKIKDKEYVTEKVEINTVLEGMGDPLKSKQVIVMAPGIPFALYAENGVCRASIQEGSIQWKGTPAWKGGVVSLLMEGRTHLKQALLEWGTDGKATLQKP